MTKYWVLVDSGGLHPIFITWNGWTATARGALKFDTQAEAIKYQSERTHLKIFKPIQMEFENLDKEQQPREANL